LLLYMSNTPDILGILAHTTPNPVRVYAEWTPGHRLNPAELLCGQYVPIGVSKPCRWGPMRLRYHPAPWQPPARCSASNRARALPGAHRIEQQGGSSAGHVGEPQSCPTRRPVGGSNRRPQGDGPRFALAIPEGAANHVRRLEGETGGARW